jgi:hypothetical protein
MLISQKDNAMNHVEKVDIYYEMYAKNTILAFLKDITHFTQSVFESSIELQFDFYSKKPVISFFAHNKKLNHSTINYLYEKYKGDQHHVLFDYFKNFADFDETSNQLKMNLSANIQDNLNHYIDDSLIHEVADNMLLNDYDKKASEAHELYQQYLVVSFFEELTNLVKQINLKEFSFHFGMYEQKQENYFSYGLPRDKCGDYLYDMSTMDKLNEYLQKYNEYELAIIHSYMKEYDSEEVSSEDGNSFLIQLNQNFTDNIQNNTNKKFLAQFEKNHLNETVVQLNEENNLKLKL